MNELFNKYRVVTKKNFKNNQSKWYSNDYFDFGKYVLLEYTDNKKSNQTLDEALQKLIVEFKNFKFSDTERHLKWAKLRKKEGILEQDDIDILEKHTKNLRVSLAKEDSLKAYNLLKENVLRKTGVYRLEEFLLGDVLKKYDQTVKNLYQKSEKLYQTAEEMSKYLKFGQKLLSNNQKTFQKHYDTKNRKQFKDNLRLSLEWCKNPSNLKDTDKLEEIKIVKANLEDFKKLIDHEKFIEKEYFNFLDGLENLKQHINHIELQLSRKSLVNETINFLNEHMKISKDEFMSNSENLIVEINEIESKLLNNLNNIQKPYFEINDFLISEKKLLIITGMAGTGKTECINKIIEKYTEIYNLSYLDSLNKKIGVCSKTTVGASNIRQKGFFNAKTLSYYFNRWNKSEKLDLFIVDEANMLTKQDLNKINNLFNENSGTKFIFIGDDGQFRPFDFDKGAESESYALNLNYCSKIFGSGLKVTLENDFRLKNTFSTEYFNFLKSLRTDKNNHPLQIMDDVLKNTNDIEVIQESNNVVKFFNTQVHIGSSVRERLKTDTNDEVLYYLKKKEEFQAMNFKDKEALDGIELYKGQKTRRPELGNLYAQYYPKVKKRLSKKNDLNTIVSLFRSNIKADSANILIRPHIFDDYFDVDKTILKGEVMFIKQLRNSFFKDYLLKTELDVGDSFIVVEEPKRIKFLDEDSSFFNNYIKDKVWLLEVKPVLKFSNRKLGSFLLNALPEIFQLDKRRIVVWIGDLIELKDNNEELLEDKELSKIYNQITDEITNLRLDPDFSHGLTKEDISKIARVKYDYARVSFAAQGGEWDKVIIQLEDTWDESRFLYTCFTRAMEKNYIFN